MTTNTSSEVSKQELLDTLTAEHRRLDAELQQLERRRALTPSERDAIARLKKQKLLTKDRIARLS
ncbi:MAG TPA: YdcH family protein [Kofleriaceae bacterium]